MEIHKQYTTKQRKEAKRLHKRYKNKNYNNWINEREKLVTIITTTKITPNFNLVLKI